MPIDTPYNQEIARQYNAINRRRAEYNQVHMSKMGGNELINYASVSGGASDIGSAVGHAMGWAVNKMMGKGSTGRMVGSGVGRYKKQAVSGGANDLGMYVGRSIGWAVNKMMGKGKADPNCPKGHEVCSCSGGNNPGLAPQTRMEMNLGAGKLRPNTNGGMYGSNRSVRGGINLSDLYEKGKKVVHKVKKVAHKAKEGYDHLKKAYDVGQDIYKEVKGGKRGGARAEIVRKVMREQGLKMIDASKYVKAHNLY